jgi:hypothetical protein
MDKRLSLTLDLDLRDRKDSFVHGEGDMVDVEEEEVDMEGRVREWEKLNRM